MTASAERAQVLVAGGGPVGMLLAADLAERHVHTVVLESRPEPRDVPRAGMLHARTVQTLLRRGYLSVPDRADPEAPLDRRSTGFHFAGRPLLRISAPRPRARLSSACPSRRWRRPSRHGHGTPAPSSCGTTRSAECGRTSGRCGSPPSPERGRAPSTPTTWPAATGARSVVRTQAGFPVTETPATFSGLVGMVELAVPAAVDLPFCGGEARWLSPNQHATCHPELAGARTGDWARADAKRKLIHLAIRLGQ